MTIYAIVVTYNGSTWIDKCFGSLVRSSIRLKILAIDNGSTDGTPENIRQNFPQVEVIETGCNIGFGKANNIGLKRVLDEKAEYALLLNQDAWIEENTVAQLIEVQKAHKEFGLLSPIPFDGEGRATDYLYSKFYKKGIIRSSEFTNKTFEIEFINAACWLMSHRLIDHVGGFHRNFMMHGEDKNYVDRVHCTNGIKIGITLSSKYFHDRQSREISETTPEKQLYALKSKLKTVFYDPNYNIVAIFLRQLTYYTLMTVKGKQRLKTTIPIMGYCAKLFFQALGQREIKVKL